MTSCRSRSASSNLLSASRSWSVHEGGVARAGRPAAEHALTYLDRLPTLAPIAIKLMRTSADGAGEIAALMGNDPALLARAVPAVKSALATGGSVASIEQAVATLGFARIRSLVVAVEVYEWLSAPNA